MAKTVYEQLLELHKTESPCVVKYGTRVTVSGVITAISPERHTDARVWVRSKLGEYSIPLTSVHQVTKK